MDDFRSGFEARVLEGGAVTEVLGLEIVRLLVEIVGVFVMLARFGVFALGEEVFGFILANGGQSCKRGQQKEESWAHQASHSMVLTYSFRSKLRRASGHS